MEQLYSVIVLWGNYTDLIFLKPGDLDLGLIEVQSNRIVFLLSRDEIRMRIGSEFQICHPITELLLRAEIIVVKNSIKSLKQLLQQSQLM